MPTLAIPSRHRSTASQRTDAMIRVIMLAITFVMLCACKSAPPKLPKWQETKLEVKAEDLQHNSPCGPHLKGLPASRQIKINGHVFYQIVKARAICLFARAKVGKSCRGACAKRLAQAVRGHKHIVKTVFAVSRRREQRLVDHHRREMTRNTIRVILWTGTIAIVLGVVGGVLVTLYTVESRP